MRLVCDVEDIIHIQPICFHELPACYVGLKLTLEWIPIRKITVVIDMKVVYICLKDH